MPESAGTGTTRLLVVEDDAEMRRVIALLLEADGYQVDAVTNVADALASVTTQQPDLVLLDVVLGFEDGRDLLAELRRSSDVPVVMLTGRGLEKDRITGLKMGADDYVVKPFSPGELSARVEAVLRRSQTSRRRPFARVLRFSGLRIDLESREVVSGAGKVELTAKEFDLLVFLASSPGQVFSRQQLLQHVWSSSNEWQDPATVTEHIRRVRQKVEADPDRPRWITTVRGVGYRFEPEEGAGPESASPS